MEIIADVVMPSRKAGREVEHTVLSSRMLSPLLLSVQAHSWNSVNDNHS